MSAQQRILAVLLIFTLLSAGCAVPIQRIVKNPARFNGKKVHVHGRVISSLDLREINCFTIRDKSAKILVVTDNMLPLKNDKIRVKGTVEQQYPYKDQYFLIIKEKKLKLRKPPKSKKILDKL